MSRFEKAFIDSFIFIIIISYFIRIISIPVFSIPDDIFIFGIYKNYDPLSNYLRFIIIFIAAISFYILSIKKVFSITDIFLKKFKKNISLYTYSVFILIFILLFLTLIDNINLIFKPLDQSIGESEFFGYLPTLYQSGFKEIYSIHGGMDILIPVISKNIFGEQKIIIGSLLISNNIIPIINIILILFINYLYCSFRFPKLPKIYLLSIITLIFFLLNNSLYITNRQDSFFLLSILILIYINISNLSLKKTNFLYF